MHKGKGLMGNRSASVTDFRNFVSEIPAQPGIRREDYWDW
jgi:hypothetical protein